MKNNMTKKQRLAAYKAAKAAAKAEAAASAALVVFLEECLIAITSSYRDYYHDCIVVSKDPKRLEDVKIFLGEPALRHSGGRFEFPVEEFFNFAGRYNPHLLNVLPSKVHTLYKEGKITFTLEEVQNRPSLGSTTAIFKIVAV